jgi:hypothetical protein
MFDQLVADTAGTHGAGAVGAWTRVENAACARRLAAMVTMLDACHAADGSVDREQWCLDNWGAVCAQIGAAQQLTSGAASRLLLVAVALRDRLPHVGALFTSGTIGYRLVATIARRSGLVRDPAALRAVDAALADAVRQWGPMSVDKTEQAIDTLIAEFDPYALPRTQDRARGRCVEVFIDDASGLANLWGTLFATDGKALDARLDGLAGTVCPHDPRTRDQRRADALGTLLDGRDRLTCLCGNPDCPATEAVARSVVIHVVAHADALTDTHPPANPTPDQPHGPDCDSGPDCNSGPDPDQPHREDADAGSDQPDGASSPENEAAPDPSQPHHDQAVESSDEPTANVTAPADADTVPAAADTVPAAGPTSPTAAAQHRSLDGTSPPLLSKPLREMTLTEVIAECNADPGEPFATTAGLIIGGPLLPGPVAARSAVGATIVPIVHPGLAPPEPRYTPSTALADFVRCRDLTCRFPGCDVPATACDVDHTIAYPHGPTCASNLKCLCRLHHLLKTFWAMFGWHERQHPDGTIVWTDPDGQTYTTHPGSRLLFPTLCAPTAPVAPVAETTAPTPHPGLTMPRRTTTRRQDRQHRITEERRLNQIDADRQAQESIPPF